MHPIAVSSLFTAALLAVEHYALARLRSKPLHPTLNYGLGVLACIVPLSIAWVEMGMIAAVLYLWIAFATGGAAVVLMYVIDQVVEDRVRVRELKEQVDHLTKGEE